MVPAAHEAIPQQKKRGFLASAPPFFGGLLRHDCPFSLDRSPLSRVFWSGCRLAPLSREDWGGLEDAELFQARPSVPVARFSELRSRWRVRRSCAGSECGVAFCLGLVRSAKHTLTEPRCLADGDLEILTMLHGVSSPNQAEVSVPFAFPCGPCVFQPQPARLNVQ